MSKIWQRPLLAALLLAVPTASQAFEKCEPFAVVGTNDGRVIEFVDHGKAGISPGDLRVGSGPLLTADGEQVGEIHWVATVMQPGADGNTRFISEGALRLPTGDILYKMLPEATHRDPDITHLSSAPVEATRIITGGTGVFAGASGNLGWDRNDKDDLTFTVNIACD